MTTLVFLRDRGIFLLWGLLIVVFAFWCSPYFFTVDNALLIANAAALTALFAAGVGIGIMTGVLDLSLPGTAAIASCVCGWLLTHGYATWIALAAGLGCGVVVGLVNGFISLRGFNPIIVTIGTLSVLSGLAAVVAGGYTFPGLTQLEFMGTHRYLATGDFPGVPAPVFIVGAVFVVGTVFLTRTRDGIRLMAVGGNAEAVRRSGIHSDRYQVRRLRDLRPARRPRRAGHHRRRHRGEPGRQPGDHLHRPHRGGARRRRPDRWPGQPAPHPGRRADPGHDRQRPDHPRHPALLGDRLHRCRCCSARSPSSGSSRPASPTA